MTNKALLIDAEKREVREITVSSLKDMQTAVGGLICYGHTLKTRDEIYVDDEGLLKGYEHFFWPKGRHEPLAGNGVVLGPTDDEGNNTDVVITAEELRAQISFLHMSQVAHAVMNPKMEMMEWEDF